MILLFILWTLFLGSSPVAGQAESLDAEWGATDLEYRTPLFPGTVFGTASDDHIEIYYDGEDTSLVGRVNGVKAFRFSSDYCLIHTFYTPVEPPVLRVFAGPGADTITVDIPHSQCPCEIRGGLGDDELQINGCSGGNVHGDSGDDRIVIEELNESLKVYGDNGNNLLEIRNPSSYIADHHSK